MPRRPRSAPTAPAAHARVHALLGAPVRGWVPPAEVGDAAAEPSVEPLRLAVPTAGEPSWRAASGVGGSSWGAASSDPEVELRESDRGRDAGPSSGALPADGEAGDEVRAAAASWHSGTARPVRRHAAAGGGLLPTAVLHGRWQPGRSAAAGLVVVALLAAAVAGGLVLRGRPQEVAVPAVVAPGALLPGTSPAADATAAGGEVVVAVAGEVRTPGLVRLPAGSRVDDAVRAAGGALPGASTDGLNLARRLVDGEQVVVGLPVQAGAPVGGATSAVPPGLLDLNLATAGDLDDLPGIGPVLAERIVAWRTEHGRFASVDQLREVDGIGESRYQELKDKVAV